MPTFIIEQPGVPTMTVEMAELETSFGRADTNTVALVAEEVSRHHVRVKLDHDKTVLIDLKSLNGTYVNKQRIVERILADNDEIWLGSKCRITFKDDSPEIKAQRRKESTLILDIAKIKDEMDHVTAQLSMPPQSTVKITTPNAGPQLDQGKMALAFRRLDALYKASQLFSSDFDLTRRLGAVLELAMDITGADRGFIMMKEENTDLLTVKAHREMGQELNSGSPSMGIAKRAALEGEPVLMKNSEDDSQFGKRASIIMQRINSAMCVPMVVEGRIVGSLYVDSRKATNDFAEEDLELFQALANQSAMAIENVRLYEQMIETEKKRANLGRFLSPSVVDHIMSEDQDLSLGGQRIPVTILFCDIRNFTRLSENLEPHELANLMNTHFTAMTEIVFQHEGTLDKFVGDEVMAIFGAPLKIDSPALCSLKAALDMQTKNDELNSTRASSNLPELEIGIGINTGEAFTGYIGSPDRLDFSVLGDSVNTASRFCSFAKGGQVIAGKKTYLEAADFVEARSAGTPTLKGKTELVEAFEILGLKTE
jgi:adenylate cyclase